MPNLKRILLPPDISEDYSAGMTIEKIAGKHGVSYSTARRCLIDMGVKLRTISDAMRVSDFDRVSHSRRLGKRKRSDAERAKIRAARLARPALGYTLKPNGYYEFTNGPNKGRSVHRVVAEITLGRALAKDEVVHHKDRDRSNNHPSNLEVMTRSQHTALHRKEGW